MARYPTSPSATSTTISVLAGALIALGIVMVFSATAGLNSPSLTQNLLKNPSFRQALFSIAGLITLLAVGL